MSAFFGALGSYRGTFGATLNSQIQSDIFYARARDYPTTLEAALDGPNIPTSVYTRLVDGVNKHLPTFHRYLKLRQKMMGVSELHYYDLYAPLVASVDLTYTPEEAAEAHPRRAEAARHRLHQRASRRPSTSAGSICCRARASAPAPTRTAAPTTSTRSCCSTTTASTTTSARWRTSSGTRCTATTRTRRSRSRPPPIRSSSPRSRRRSTKRCSSTTCSRTSRTTRPSCRCSATTSKASRRRCSGRRSSPSSSCARTRWPKRASRSPARRSTSSTRT